MSEGESRNKLELSIVLPIRNEEAILHTATGKFAEEFDRVVGPDSWQFIFVENGSSDRSHHIIQEIIRERRQSKEIRLPNANYGEALRAGLLDAEGSWVFILNVDHLWDPPFFEWAWRHRHAYDLILGSKRADPTLNRQDQYRRVLSAGLNACLQYLFDFVGADSHGMKFMRRETIIPHVEACKMRRGQFDTEMTLRALRASLWVAEAPIPYEEVRKPRNLMIQKICWNLWDLLRFRKVMKSVSYQGNLKYRRYCREDLLGPPPRKMGQRASSARVAVNRFSATENASVFHRDRISFRSAFAHPASP